jgi:hypothetical protein
LPAGGQQLKPIKAATTHDTHPSHHQHINIKTQCMHLLNKQNNTLHQNTYQYPTLFTSATT